jgi:polyisoprenoid-binding protein YceI
MSHGSWRSVSIAAWLVAQAPIHAGVGSTVLTIDAANSQVLVQVGKAGVFGFAGHAHEVTAANVSGQVVVNRADLSQASVSFDVAAASLRVSGKDEPPADVGEVQRVMLSDRVLDAARFPRISFRSSRVSVASLTATDADLLVEGALTLHGTTHPVTFRARAAFDAQGRLTARGSCPLRQSDFGMVPVTAAGGTIRVRDEVEVQFVLRARPSDVPGTVR